MFCPQCGEENPDGAKFCTKCGAALKAKAEKAPAPAPAATGERTSGMCVAALVMGILGLFFNLLAILAIIFGGIGMSQTGKDPNLKGRGMAVAGLVLGIIGIIGWIIAIIWWSAFWWFI
jgi:uncharacterized membrane protein YvbJ